MGKLLAVDWGTSKIGLAISDQDQQFAFHYQVLENKSPSQVVQELSDICTQEEVCEIIVGLPISLTGDEKAMAGKAREFINHLTEKIDLPLSLEDERMTSSLARRQLKDNPRAVNQKDDVQMESARIILEDALKRRKL